MKPETKAKIGGLTIGLISALIIIVSVSLLGSRSFECGYSIESQAVDPQCLGVWDCAIITMLTVFLALFGIIWFSSKYLVNKKEQEAAP